MRLNSRLNCDVLSYSIYLVLAELGFHWNGARQSWQHPCGTIPGKSATYDPRQRYGSYFAADALAA